MLFAYAHAQCADPSALSVASTTANSVSISFTSSGSSPWQVQYGPVGFQLGNGTTQNISSKTPSIGGLSGATTYDLYVRDICGSQYSAWVGPVTFTTSCSGFMQAPFSTGFESSDWQVATSISAPGTVSNCWDVSPVGSLFAWSVGPPFINQVQTGPDFDHTTGWGKYLHVGSFGLSNDLITYLTTPRIDLSASSAPVLEYWYHMYGAGIGDLIVLIRNYQSTAWDTLQVLSGQQHPSASSPWTLANFSLSAYASDTVEIQFVGTRPAYNPSVEIAIDDLYIGDKPSCPSSKSFQVISNNSNSALLDWVPDSTYYWQIQYGTTGFSLGSGTVVNTATHPTRINGLLPNTMYDFYLRDSCTATSKSFWFGPITLRTDCGEILAPFAEDFEDSIWVKPTAYGAVGTVDTCWVRPQPLNYFWEVGPPVYQTIFTGPSGDHTTGTGKYLFTERKAVWANTKAPITTPLLNLDSITEPELTFWYHLHGTNIAGMDVAIDSGNGFELIYQLIGEQQVSDSAPWKEAVINLADYGAKTVKIRFTGRSIYTFTNITQAAIDDFSIHEAPNCPKPINIEADQVDVLEASVSWTTGGSSQWHIKYKPTGGAGYTTLATSSNPVMLSNLQSDTEYEVWVRDSCGVNDVSVWNGPIVFRTLCGPISTPFYENFDGPDFKTPQGYWQSGELNSCWRRKHNKGYYWETGPPYFVTISTGPIGDHTTGGGKYLVSDQINFVTRDTAYIYSPDFDLTNLAVPEMAFWYHMYGTGINALLIEADSGTGWHLIDTLTGQQQFTKYDAWKERVIDLTNYTNDTIGLRFAAIRNTYTTNAEIAIDDLHIYDAPNCDKPTNFTLNNVRSSRATFSWTPGGTSSSTLRFKPQGGAFANQNTSTNTNYVLTGLIPDTQYEVWVRDSCTNGNVSLWVGPIVFRTECTPTYAPYSESFDGGDWVPSSITKVIGQINSCWKRPDTTYLSWIPYTGNAFSTISGPAGPRNGTGNFVAFNNVTFTLPETESEFLSPTVIISNLITPELNFWYHMFGQHTGKLEVYAQYLNGSRTLLHTITGQQHSSKLAPWSQKTISLQNLNNDTVKIVFKGYKSTGFSSMFNISIDDVEIVDAFCWAPSALASANPTRTSIELSWQSNSVRSNLEYGPTGFLPGQGTVINNVSSPYLLTGLQPYSTYNYYIQDSCRANNSTWTGPGAFITYCDTINSQIDFTPQGLVINFDATDSHGSDLSYFWDFGDGTNGSGAQPVHNYSTAGFYNVSLIASDTCGQSDTTVLNLQVCDAPIAVINYSLNGLIVSFDGTSSQGAAKYYWDFGPAGTYVNATPLVAFPSKTIYSIYLVVTNSCGNQDTTFMDLNLCDKPTADFSYQVISSGGSGMTVAFDGTFSQLALSYQWFFGDGNTDTTTLTPTHTYAVPGLHYEVTLIVEGDCGRKDTLSYKLQDVVSIDESDLQPFTVYPNPTQGKLIIEWDGPIEKPDFRWFDMAGKAYLFAYDQQQMKFEFDLTNAANGQYMVMIQAGGKTWAVKVKVE